MNITKAQHFESLIRSAKPGETVIVEAGDYKLDEVWIKRSAGHGGKKNFPVHLKASGEVNLIRSSRRFIIHADYMIIDGFNFNNWRLEIFGTGNIVIDNTYRGSQPKYGFIEAGGRDLLIDNNDIQISGNAGNTRDHGIYLHAGVNITCRENIVKGSSGYGIHIYDEHKMTNPIEPLVMRNYLIEGNDISESKTRSGLIVAKGSRGSIIVDGIVIKDNIFSHNQDAGVVIRDGKNISVINNKFYDDNLVALVPITREGNVFNGMNEPPNTEPPAGEPGDEEPVNEEGVVVVEDDKFKVTIERK